MIGATRQGLDPIIQSFEDNPRVSYGLHFWQANLFKELSRGAKKDTYNPMSMLSMAMFFIIFTVSHMALAHTMGLLPK